MHKRITELANKSGIFYTKHYDLGSVVVNRAEVKKFAELIIKECAYIAARNQAENMGWDISEIIKEHFGVEE